MRPLLLAGLFLLILLTVLCTPVGVHHYALLAGMPLLMLFWWTNTQHVASTFRYGMLFALLANFSQDISAIRLYGIRFDGTFLGFWLFMLPYLFTLFCVPVFLVYTLLQMRYRLRPRSGCNWVAVFGFVPITTMVVLTFVYNNGMNFTWNWLNLLFIAYAMLLYVLFESVVHGFSSPVAPGARLALVAGFMFVMLRYKLQFPSLPFGISLPVNWPENFVHYLQNIAIPLLLYVQNACLALLVYATARYLNSRVIP